MHLFIHFGVSWYKVVLSTFQTKNVWVMHRKTHSATAFSISLNYSDTSPHTCLTTLFPIKIPLNIPSLTIFKITPSSAHSYSSMWYVLLLFGRGLTLPFALLSSLGADWCRACVCAWFVIIAVYTETLLCVKVWKTFVAWGWRQSLKQHRQTELLTQL